MSGGEAVRKDPFQDARWPNWVLGFCFAALLAATALSDRFHLLSPMKNAFRPEILPYMSLSALGGGAMASLDLWSSPGPGRRSFAWAALAGCGLAYAFQEMLNAPLLYVAPLMIGICWMAASWRALGDPGARPRARALLKLGVAFPLIGPLEGFFLRCTVPWHPVPLDARVLAVDFSLVGPALLRFVNWSVDQALLSWVIRIAYWALPAFLIAGYLVSLRREEDPRIYPLQFMLLALAGFGAYNLVPVIGPVHALPVIFGKAAIPPASRNCMPSLHLAWALLVLGALWPSGRLARAVGLVYAALVALATVALGYHYLSDLIVAVPLVIAIRAIRPAERPPLRTWVFLALTVGWLILFRDLGDEAFRGFEGWITFWRGLAGGTLLLSLAAALPWTGRRFLPAFRDPGPGVA